MYQYTYIYNIFVRFNGKEKKKQYPKFQPLLCSTHRYINWYICDIGGECVCDYITSQYMFVCIYNS